MNTKVIIVALFSIFTLVSCGTNNNETPVVPSNPDSDTDPDDTTPETPTTPEPEIFELKTKRSLKTITSNISGIEPFSDHYFKNFNDDISSYDFSNNYALLESLCINNENTIFPSENKLPKGYDSDELIEWGKYPGLNMDILWKHGFDGNGSTVAYVDQPIKMHSEYKDANLHYYNLSDSNNSMHGPAVTSLLLGKDIGVAPKIEDYLIGISSWKADQTAHAQGLYKIIELNKSLPSNKKISMVGFSDNIDESEKNPEAFREAVKACNDAGIMVWFCGSPLQFMSASFLPLCDKNSVSNLVKDNWTKNFNSSSYLWVPASGRTRAFNQNSNEDSYTYDGTAGVSWTTPYVLGLAAQAYTIDNTLTQEDIVSLLRSTSYKDVNGMTYVINPVGFIAGALKRVGRDEEADLMLNEVEEREKYSYAIFNSNKLTDADITSIEQYLATITSEKIYCVNVKKYSNAIEIYNLLKEDKKTHKGQLQGIQIFGDDSVVPSFDVNYSVLNSQGIDDMGKIKSDLFYSTFDNDLSNLSEFSVRNNFANNLNYDLIPNWKTTRLMLKASEFTNFFTKYYKALDQTHGENMDLVNFSNPIFKQANHADDFGAFLNRMDSEFDMIDTNYSLYGNLDGDYPVNAKVLGNFTKDNLTKTNEEGSYEYIINTHGQANNVDRCIFIDGVEKRESLMNSDNINDVFNKNPYYLDMWTCNNAYALKNNLIETALNGNCIGAFAASMIISNNGVNNKASVEAMKKANFYYFYYSYLLGLHQGYSRSDAFFFAQQEYSVSLMECSKNPALDEGNFQYNYYNVFVYHNLGVFENTYTGYLMSDSVVTNDDVNSDYNPDDDSQSSAVSGGINKTNGKEITDYAKCSFTKVESTNLSCELKSISFCLLDNEYVRFKFEGVTEESALNSSLFNPPNGSIFMYSGDIEIKNGAFSFTVDVSFDNVTASSFITNGYFMGSKRLFYAVGSLTTIKAAINKCK